MVVNTCYVLENSLRSLQNVVLAKLDNETVQVGRCKGLAEGYTGIRCQR